MGPRLATFHNLTFYATMMLRMREAVLQGRFAQWKNSFEDTYLSGG